MNFLFDLKSTQPIISKRHGGGRYGEVIFFRMIKRNLPIYCFYDSSLWFNPDVKDFIEENKVKLIDSKGRTIQSIVDEYNIDVLFTPVLRKEYTDHPVHGCKLVATLHDIKFKEIPMERNFWYYKYPKKDQLKFLVKKFIPKSLYERYNNKKFGRILNQLDIELITVSYHSKYAMQFYFPDVFLKASLPVFYSPIISLNEGDNPKTTVQYENSEKYFLSVSGHRWEKNVARSIMAFDRLVDYGLIKDIRYKVTGAKREHFRFKIKHPESFDFLGYVSDEELEQLYANAYLFVYPSLGEGFGYPPLEAMRYHVPVISSPHSSMAEILDAGALYFNPFLIEEIMSRMLMMLDSGIHSEYSERGYNQYLKISERQRKDLDGVIEYLTDEKLIKSKRGGEGINLGEECRVVAMGAPSERRCA